MITVAVRNSVETNYPSSQDEYQDPDENENTLQNTEEARNIELSLIPMRSSSMLDSLFHLPFMVSYKRSDPGIDVENLDSPVKRAGDILDPQVRVMRSDSNLDRHIRVTRRSLEEALNPKIRVMKRSESMLDPQIRVMRRGSESVLGPQLRVMRRSESALGPQVRVMRRSPGHQVRVMRSEAPQIRIV